MYFGPASTVTASVVEYEGFGMYASPGIGRKSSSRVDPHRKYQSLIMATSFTARNLSETRTGIPCFTREQNHSHGCRLEPGVLFAHLPPVMSTARASVVPPWKGGLSPNHAGNSTRMMDRPRFSMGNTSRWLRDYPWAKSWSEALVRRCKRHQCCEFK